MFRPHSLASLAPFGRAHGAGLRRALSAYGRRSRLAAHHAGDTLAPPSGFAGANVLPERGLDGRLV